jgi:hypothetical protein
MVSTTGTRGSSGRYFDVWLVTCQRSCRRGIQRATSGRYRQATASFRQGLASMCGTPSAR